MRTSPSHGSDRLATIAAAAIAAWPAIVVALHILQRDNYDPANQAMSELALGRYGLLMDAAFVVFGAGLLALALGLRRTIPRAAAGPAMLAVGGLLIALSGLFQASLSGAPATTESVIHEILGVTAFITVMVAMVCCAWRFRRDPRWRPFALPTVAWTVFALATFFLVPLEATAFGIAQRLFVATWLSWTLATALRLRTTPPPPSPPQPTRDSTASRPRSITA